MDAAVLAYKEKGNEAFRSRRYQDAILAYSDGLKIHSSPVLLSNRFVNIYSSCSSKFSVRVLTS